MYHNVNNLQPTLFNKHNFEENKIISKTNKAREEITPNKSIKTPCFVPNTFQDFIEKLNEKSGLWRRKYLIISLSIRKIFFYEKKPSKNLLNKKFILFNFNFKYIMTKVKKMNLLKQTD